MSESRLFAKISIISPRIGIYSSIGRRRNNEDAAYYAVIKTTLENISTFYVIAVVADGMGGHVKGEVASRIASTIIGSHLAYYCSLVNEGGIEVDYEQAISHAFTTANNKILQYANLSPEHSGMGSTVTAAIIKRDLSSIDMWIGHVGDTRAYVITRSYIKQLTKDHSLVQELVDRGLLTPEEAKKHPQRNVVTRALGTPNVKPDILNYKLDEGSFVLLCSDGLVNNLLDSEIHKFVILNMSRNRSPTYTLSKIAEIALSRAERDNMTGLLIGPLHSLKSH